MSKNRHNQVQNPVLGSNPIPDYTPRGQKKEEVTLTFNNCCECGNTITAGYFGRWADGGTCTKKCEILYQSKQLYLKDTP